MVFEPLLEHDKIPDRVSIVACVTVPMLCDDAVKKVAIE